MKNLFNQIKSTMSNIHSAAQNAQGATKNALQQMHSALKKGFAQLAPQTPSSAPHKGPKKGKDAQRVATPVHTGAAQSLEDNFAPFFAANPQKKVLFYQAIETKAQRKQIAIVIQTAAKFGYPLRVGMNADKLQVIVAQKKETITAKPVNGFIYLTGVKNGEIQDLPKELLRCKTGQVLVNAVKPIKGKKFATVQQQAAPATQRPRKPKAATAQVPEPVSRATEATEVSSHAAGSNGSQPPMNPIDPAAHRAQKPTSAAAAN